MADILSAMAANVFDPWPADGPVSRIVKQQMMRWPNSINNSTPKDFNTVCIT